MVSKLNSEVLVGRENAQNVIPSENFEKAIFSIQTSAELVLHKMLPKKKNYLKPKDIRLVKKALQQILYQCQIVYKNEL